MSGSSSGNLTRNWISTNASQILQRHNAPVNNIEVIWNQPIQFNNFSDKNLVSFLSMYDISDCLLNFTNHADCVFSNDKFVGECQQNFTGSSCNIDKRVCSSQPCLNNGTCEDIFDEQTYSHNCTCQPFYFGSFCQFKEDVCKDEKCSSNGICVDIQNEPTCKCFQMYSGSKCEIESTKVKLIKSVISTSSLLAIIILISFYVLFLISDLCGRKRYRVKTLSSKVVYKKFNYKN